jgi:SnoaL-like polyketide cyclase
VSAEANKLVVRRYFDEVLDRQDYAVTAELFVAGAVGHFPGFDVRVVPGESTVDLGEEHLTTTVHSIIAEGDMVATRHSHTVTFRKSVSFLTRGGRFDVGGRTLSWDVLAQFHFRDGKIDEWWAGRDELQVLVQLGEVGVTSA